MSAQKIVKSLKIVESSYIIIPALHVKFGIFKNFDRSGSGFLYLKEKFPKISDAKIKERILKVP